MGPQANTFLLSDNTQIVRMDMPTFMTTPQPDAQTIASAIASDWSNDVFEASQYGVGDDNPNNPRALTDLQRGRSVEVLFEAVSMFQIRYAIKACCTTGRNFLFGGCARSLRRSLSRSLLRSL